MQLYMSLNGEFGYVRTMCHLMAAEYARKWRRQRACMSSAAHRRAISTGLRAEFTTSEITSAN